MVFDFLKRGTVEVPEAKASAAGRVMAWGGAGRVACTQCRVMGAVSRAGCARRHDPAGGRV